MHKSAEREWVSKDHAPILFQMADLDRILVPEAQEVPWVQKMLQEDGYKNVKVVALSRKRIDYRK